MARRTYVCSVSVAPPAAYRVRQTLRYTCNWRIFINRVTQLVTLRYFCYKKRERRGNIMKLLKSAHAQEREHIVYENYEVCPEFCTYL
jgi:hypothetical protein